MRIHEVTSALYTRTHCTFDDGLVTTAARTPSSTGYNSPSSKDCDCVFSSIGVSEGCASFYWAAVVRLFLDTRDLRTAPRTKSHPYC